MSKQSCFLFVLLLWAALLLGTGFVALGGAVFQTVGLGGLYPVGPRAASVAHGLLRAALASAVAFVLLFRMRRLFAVTKEIPLSDLLLATWMPISAILAGMARLYSAPPETGWLLCLEPVLVGVGFPLLLLCSGALLGQLTGLLPTPAARAPSHFLEFIVVASLLGSAGLAGGLYLAALLGLWNPVILWVLCLLVLALGLPLLCARGRSRPGGEDEGGSCPHQERGRARIDWREATMVGVLLVILQASLQLAMLPPDDSDELRYHLSIPKRYLEHGGWGTIPGQNFAHFPLGMEVLFALPLSLDWLHPAAARMGSCCGVKMVHHWYFVLTLILIRIWTRERLAADRRDSNGLGEHGKPSVAGLLVFASIPFAPVLGAWAFVDFGTAFGWLASAYFLWRAKFAPGRAEPHAERCPVAHTLAAVAVGWSLAVKYTSLAWWALLLAMLLAESLRKRRLQPGLVGMMILPALLASPWLLWNAWTTGNPFAPLLSTLFGDGFDPVQKAFYDWHAGMKGDLNLFHQLPWSERILDLITLPLRAVFFPEQFENNPLGGLLLALLPAALLGGTPRFADSATPRSRGVAFLAYLSVGVYLLWALTYRDPRFALPLWGILAMGIGLGLSKQAPGATSPRSYQRAWSALILLMALWSLGQCEELFSRVGRFSSAILLREPPDAYLTRPERIPRVAVIREVEQLRAARAEGKPALLLLGEEQSYYFDSPVRGNDYFDGPLLASISRDSSSVEEISERLKGLGTDWIWINRETLEANTFNLVRGFIFALPPGEGLAAMHELARANPLGLAQPNPWLARAMGNGAFRRMHAWLALHPGFREIPLETVAPGERPICPLGREMLAWPELNGISAADLPRERISLLVARNP